MAFLIKFGDDSVECVHFMKVLASISSAFSFECSKYGLGLNVTDDENSQAYSVLFSPEVFEEFSFVGEDVDNCVFDSNKFKIIISKLSFPFLMESTMDGSVKILSEVGRQSYKQNQLEMSDKYISRNNDVKNHLLKLIQDDDAIVVKALHSDFRNALTNISIDSKVVNIVLDKDKFKLMADSLDVEAEAEVPLHESVDEKLKWEFSYNLNFLKRLIDTIRGSGLLTLRLFHDNRSMVIEADLSKNDDGYCRMTILPILKRREAEVDSDSLEVEDDDESDVE